MSTNTNSTQTVNAFSDPAASLVTIEQATRELRGLLADMKNTDFLRIAQVANQIELCAYAIEKWANSKDCDIDDAEWQENKERWSLMVKRINKHFGGAK